MLDDVVVTIIWVGVIAYSVFGGADFGSGIWDLLAGPAASGAAVRKRIEHSIGPVWEANHVWLIFILVYLWTGFPSEFAAIVTAMFVPLLGVALGIVFRGGAFVFRKSSTTFSEARWFGGLFAVSSLMTPFFLGAVVGAVVSGRVPRDGSADPLTSWLTPASLLGGVMAVGTCMWLAAVFLVADSDRDGQPALATYFSRRAQITGVVVGAIGLIGIAVLQADAPTLADGLARRGAPFVIGSGFAAVTTMLLLRRGRFELARYPAAMAVAAIIMGWGAGQYPWVLVDHVQIHQAAASPSTLWALVGAFVLAGLLVVPSLVWLYRLTGTGVLSTPDTHAGSSQARLDELEAAASAGHVRRAPSGDALT